MGEEHCPHCGCESYDDETTCADTIAELEEKLRLKQGHHDALVARWEPHIAKLEAKLDSVRNEVIVFTTARCDCNDCYACGLKRMAQNVFTALGDDDGR